tara:strand:- start:1581 stop:2015 length:435 start_codon:yes stop_codon:yes gene_type:complete
MNELKKRNRKIYDLYTSGMKQVDIADKYGISAPRISQICKNQEKSNGKAKPSKAKDKVAVKSKTKHPKLPLAPDGSKLLSWVQQQTKTENPDGSLSVTWSPQKAKFVKTMSKWKKKGKHQDINGFARKCKAALKTLEWWTKKNG